MQIGAVALLGVAVAAVGILGTAGQADAAFTATATCNIAGDSVAISWSDASSTAVRYGVDVYFAGTVNSIYTSPDDQSGVRVGVALNTAYHLTVSAYGPLPNPIAQSIVEFTCTGPPPSEAPTSSKYYTLSLTATCVHPGTALDISWTKADHDAWYRMNVTDPDGNNPYYVYRTTDTSYTTQHTLDVDTAYRVLVTAYQTDEDPISVSTEVTCEKPPFEIGASCNSGNAATIWWKYPPAGAVAFDVDVTLPAPDYTPKYSVDWIGGSSTNTGMVLEPDTKYYLRVQAYDAAGPSGRQLGAAMQDHFRSCANTPPGVNAGDDFSWTPGVDVHLTGKIADKELHPTTKSWSCSLGNQTLPVSCPLCDNPVTTPAHITFAYGTFRMPSPLPNGAQATCTITASDGYDTASDSVTITADSSWVISDDGASQARDANDGGGDVTGDTTNNGGESGQTVQTSQTVQTVQTGGGGSGGGGGFFIPPTFFAPSTQSESEPEPEPLPISNGTIPNIRMASIPHLDMWNGTTITPFQCNVTEGGSIRLSPIYDGMELIHGTFNVTDSVTGETWEAPLDMAIPTNATATHNVTVHTTATYNHTQIRPYTVLLDIRAGGLDWSINSETLATFQDIFDTVDVLARYQYGSVLWSGMGASCSVPN